MELITLKAMCEYLHISRRSIQCYEKAGLLASFDKNKYGHLLYDQMAVGRAEKIRFLQQLGFKLKEIKDIIDAPNDVLKNALIIRVKEMEQENKIQQSLIEEAYKLINSL